MGAATGHNGEQETGKAGWRRYMGVGLVVIALAMVAGFGSYVFSLLGALERQDLRIRSVEEELAQNETAMTILMSEQAELVHLSGPGGHGSASGTLVWDPVTRSGLVSLDDLPPPGAGKEYRLWAVAGGIPAGGMSLSPPQENRSRTVLTGIPEPAKGSIDMFVVTEEPAGDRQRPSGATVAAGSPLRPVR